MKTVSSITKNTALVDLWRYDTDRIFKFLQTLLLIYHIMLLAVCITQVKRRLKKKKEKEKKNKVTKNLLLGDSNPALRIS